MKIFTKKNSEGNKTAKFVGAYVPTNLYIYLSLYTIVNGLSKTEVLNSLLNDWYSEEVKSTTEKQLIKDTVKTVLIPKWEEVAKKKVKIDTFITQISEELKKQGFDETLIANMIKVFRYDTK
jgi:hypothetical protein